MSSLLLLLLVNLLYSQFSLSLFRSLSMLVNDCVDCLCVCFVLYSRNNSAYCPRRLLCSFKRVSDCLLALACDCAPRSFAPHWWKCALILPFFCCSCCFVFFSFWFLIKVIHLHALRLRSYGLFTRLGYNMDVSLNGLIVNKLHGRPSSFHLICIPYYECGSLALSLYIHSEFIHAAHM